MSPLIGISAVVLGSLWVVGCGGPAGTPSGAPLGPATTGDAGAGSTTLAPGVSINAMMVAMVDHAGHALWDVEREGKAPSSDADWNQVTEHAVQTVAAATAITTAGTGPSDAVWTQSTSWRAHAQRMSAAGQAALAAARGKNFDALVKANGDLVDACEGCHKEFKPDLPTEGIVHTHAH